MAISTILWKIRVWPLCLLLMLLQIGCSMGVHSGVSSSYSTEAQQYMQLGYLKHNDPWRDVWPMITFDNSVTVKVHPTSWHSFTHNKTQCSEEYSEFFFQMWSREDILFDASSSYFVSPTGKEIAISEIKIAEESTVLYSVHEREDDINIMSSNYPTKMLYELWRSGNHREMKKSSGESYLKITTQQQVGCPFDYYQLYLAFRHGADSKVTGYWLYFFPVEYKTFSR